MRSNHIVICRAAVVAISILGVAVPSIRQSHIYYIHIIIHIILYYNIITVVAISLLGVAVPSIRQSHIYNSYYNSYYNTL